jgi:transposase
VITLPKYYFNKSYHTDVLNEKQLNFVARNLPEPSSEIGRPAYSNVELLPGILIVLRSGCRWRDLNMPGFPDGSTHWRRLRYWKRKVKGRPPLDECGRNTVPKTYFGLLWEYILSLLSRGNKLDTRFVCLDGTLIPSFDFTERVSFSGKHHTLGVKASILVDAQGIPLAVTIAPGAWNDMRLAIGTIETIKTDKNLFGSFLLADKGYDSLPFRSYLEHKGLQPNIPKRSTTKIGNQKKLYAYHELLGTYRFIVKRTNAWMKSFKRLHFRFDRTTYSFECFLYLAIIVICVRKLMS